MDLAQKQQIAADQLQYQHQPPNSQRSNQFTKSQLQNLPQYSSSHTQHQPTLNRDPSDQIVSQDTSNNKFQHPHDFYYVGQKRDYFMEDEEEEELGDAAERFGAGEGSGVRKGEEAGKGGGSLSCEMEYADKGNVVDGASVIQNNYDKLNNEFGDGGNRVSGTSEGAGGPMRVFACANTPGTDYGSPYVYQMTKSEVHQAHLAQIDVQQERIKQEIREEKRRMEEAFGQDGAQLSALQGQLQNKQQQPGFLKPPPQLESRETPVQPVTQPMLRQVPKINQFARISEFQNLQQYSEISSKISPRSTKNINSSNKQISSGFHNNLMAQVSRTNRQSKPQMMLQDAWIENDDDKDLNDRESLTQNNNQMYRNDHGQGLNIGTASPNPKPHHSKNFSNNNGSKHREVSKAVKHPKSSRSRGSKCSAHSGRGGHSRKKKEAQINNLNLRTDRLNAVMHVEQNSQSQGSRAADSRSNRTIQQDFTASYRDKEGPVGIGQNQMNQSMNMMQKQGVGMNFNNISSPRTFIGNVAQIAEQNLISSFDQIEEARLGFEDFKKDLFELISMFDVLTDKISTLKLQKTLDYDHSNYGKKVTNLKSSLTQVESILEGLAQGFTKQLNETHSQNLQIERDRDELSQSLQQIELCYQQNKQKLERDLNKMEFKVKVFGKDAREKMQLRNIKALDIVESEVKRMMPPTNNAGTIELDDRDDETTMEQIKKDLDNVDDVFIANAWSAGLGQVPGGSKRTKDGSNLNNDGTEEQPDEEWLQSSSEEERLENNGELAQFDVSQEISIQQMKQEQEKILQKFDKQGDQQQKVLVKQLLDMEIDQKKKQIKEKIKLNPPQSYRQNQGVINNLSQLIAEGQQVQNTDFKSHSLKNSQTIRASKLQNTPSDSNQDDSSVRPPSGHVISRENILRPGGMINNQFDQQSEEMDNDYMDAREKPSNLRLTRLGSGVKSLTTKEQEGAIQIVDQQESKDTNFKQIESSDYHNRFGNTEPVARQDLRSFDDVSLGSPAATVVTIKSSQATYNTATQVAPLPSEINQLSGTKQKIQRESQLQMNLNKINSEPNQKQVKRVSIPTPVSMTALENIECSDAQEKPQKNINAMQVNEDQRIEEPASSSSIGGSKLAINQFNSQPEARNQSARPAKVTLIGQPIQQVPVLQKLKVQPVQKIQLSSLMNKNKISIIKKNPVQKSITNQILMQQQSDLQQSATTLQNQQSQSNIAEQNQQVGQEVNKLSFVSAGNNGSTDQQTQQVNLQLSGSVTSQLTHNQKKITLIKQNHIKRVQLPQTSHQQSNNPNNSYNDTHPQQQLMDKAGMTQLSVVSAVSGVSGLSGLSGSLGGGLEAAPLQRLKIKKSPMQTANFGSISNYTAQKTELFEPIQGPQQKQLPTFQMKQTKRLQLQQRQQQIQTIQNIASIGLRGVVGRDREGSGLPRNSGRAGLTAAGTGGDTSSFEENNYDSMGPANSLSGARVGLSLNYASGSGSRNYIEQQPHPPSITTSSGQRTITNYNNFASNPPPRLAASIDETFPCALADSSSAQRDPVDRGDYHDEAVHNAVRGRGLSQNDSQVLLQIQPKQ